MLSLRETHPDLAAEWADDWNAPLTADEARPDWRRQVHWRCQVNPNHVWRAGIRARVNGDGCCQFCWVAPESAKAKDIAGALLATFEFDPTGHKIPLPEGPTGHKIPLPEGRGADDVDILIPHPFGRNKALVVEFDSHFKHKCRGETCDHRAKCPHRDDRAKTIRLQQAGYVVVRMCEEPLDAGCRDRKHHRHDIYVRKSASSAEIARRVVERVR